MFIFFLKTFNRDSFWGRDMGKEYREIIIENWRNSNEDTLLIDFTDISVVDFSFASEVIAVLISRLSGELNGRHMILTNLSASVKENITAALEKAEMCCLLIDTQNNKWQMIGKCSDGLVKLFQLIYEEHKTDSPTLAKKLDTTVQVVNNRLRTLTNLGLVNREESTAPSGGKQYEYISII